MPVTGSIHVFCVVVRKDSVVQIRVIHPLGGGTTLEIDTGSSDTSIPPESGDCTDQGTWVIEQGTLTDSEGEQTDCSTLNVPYEGTCAEDMTDMFVCFDPQGACSYDMAAGEISYANGAKMTTTGLQSELYGADGTFCASMSTEIDTAGLAMTTYTDANGESWVLTYDEQGDETIECPNGESIMLTSEQMTALQACSGTGASSGDSASGDDSCEIVGGGMSGVTQCTDTSDCASGEVCCPSVGYCLPDIEGICDA